MSSQLTAKYLDNIRKSTIFRLSRSPSSIRVWLRTCLLLNEIMIWRYLAEGIPFISIRYNMVTRIYHRCPTKLHTLKREMTTTPIISSTSPLHRVFSHIISISGSLRPLLTIRSKSQWTHHCLLTKLIMEILTQSRVASKCILCQHQCINRL